MSIPKEIKRIHVEKAIEDLKKEGTDPKRVSTKYNIPAEGIALEPKRIVSRAAFYAIGRELPSKEFNGGKEANDFLESLGFKVRLGGTKA